MRCILPFHPMAGALWDHFRPAAWGGDAGLHAVLRDLGGKLRDSSGSRAAVRLVKARKLDVFARLRARFPVPVAQALTLKILNICLARCEFRARNTSLAARPAGLVVDPSNMCRLACPGCVHSAGAGARKLFDWRNGTLSTDLFAALLRLYGPYLIGVSFYNYGEPLLNRHTPELIRLAKRYLLSTALSTSLSVEWFDAEAFVESGLDFMVLSIDGATQAVYERFRRNGDLELVLANVRRLVDARQRLGRHTPVLSWNFLAFKHNAHEIRLAERRARQLGVNVFRVVNPFDVTWDDAGIRPARLRGGVQRLRWPSTPNLPDNWNPFPDDVDADTIGRAFESPWEPPGVDDERPRPGATCHWLYKNMVMDACGRILPCCGPPRPDGNLLFATLDQGSGAPFNSEKYRRARAFFRGDRSAGDGLYCQGCEWNKTAVNIGGAEIRRYFRAADAALFGRQSLMLLSDW